MKDTNLLISVGVLQNYWENGKKDTFDLLLPFLKSTLSKTSEVNKMIDFDLLTKTFKRDYGYSDIPNDVIKSMLNRLSPEIIAKENNCYYLKKTLDEDEIIFEKKRKTCKEHYEIVVSKLKTHLLSNGIDLKENEISENLYNFFSFYGLQLSRDLDDLIFVSKKEDRIFYEIASFIIHENNSQTVVFDYILEIVQGFFVSTVLSLSHISASNNSKFKELSCYIDTRIIIDALGFHLPRESKETAVEFIKMLKESGATLYCFEHNLKEIKNVLNAYRNSINKPINNASNTLEALDEKEYSISDVDRLLSKIEVLITDLGINIIRTPIYDKESIFFDVEKLEETIKEKLSYKTQYSDSGLKSDVQSIASIAYLRKDFSAHTIEKAKHIFISSNNKYCQLVTDYISKFTQEKIALVYSEREFASLLWLRCYSTHKDYPKKKLIENAMSVLEVPTQSFLNSLFSVIDKLKTEGGITNDEAIILRSDYYCKKEMLITCKGDENNISQDNLLLVKNNLIKKYTAEQTLKNDLIYEKYVEIRDKNKEIKNKARTDISQTGDKIYKMVNTFLVIITTCLCFLILFLCIYIVINNFSNATISIPFIIISIVDIIGYFSEMNSIHRFIIRIIHRVSKFFSDKAMDAKRKKYINILEDL